jgi:stearoyl-CoA desaturase (delta-9 desaturase)
MRLCLCTDYRNGIRAFDYDPTKWLIRSLYTFGLTSDLHQFPSNEIAKGQVVMRQKGLEKAKRAVQWPAPTKSLPIMEWKQIRERVSGERRALVVVNNVVCVAASFV